MTNVNDLARTASMSFRFNRMLSLSDDLRKKRFRGRTALKSVVDNTFNASPLLIDAFVDSKLEHIEYAEPVEVS